MPVIVVKPHQHGFIGIFNRRNAFGFLLHLRQKLGESFANHFFAASAVRKGTKPQHAQKYEEEHQNREKIKHELCPLNCRRRDVRGPDRTSGAAPY